MRWNLLAEKSCCEELLSHEEALGILRCPDESLLTLLDASFRVRKKYFGLEVRLNYLLNAKSGFCAEDCLYCSQSKISKAEIKKYPFLNEDEILKSAVRAVELNASRFCMVNSGREPAKSEVDRITSAVLKIKEKYPHLELCVCLGLLKEELAKELKKCGVFAYNHNLNTSEKFYPKISSTHTYQDRLKTVGIVKDAGLSACSGCIFGLGEKDEDRVELAFELRKIGADSIPLNFLIPIAGTPLENQEKLSPQECLKIIALFRFLNPKSEIRIAGGREVNLRWMQPFGLYPANSIFIGDYLTTKGQKPETDIAMIRDLGFKIAGECHSRKLLRSEIKESAFEVKLK